MTATPILEDTGLAERLRLAHDWLEERGQRYHAKTCELAARQTLSNEATRPLSMTGEMVEAAERAVRITVWNFLRERGASQEACYPIIEGAATNFRAAIQEHQG